MPFPKIFRPQNSALDQSVERSLRLPLQLESGNPPQGAIRFVHVVLGLLIGGVAWAILAQFDELAIAEGEIIPSQSVRTLAHLEGGIIEDLRVREGEVVEAGEVIAELRPVAVAGDRDALLIRATAARLRAARLDALVNDTALDTAAFAAVPSLLDRAQITLEQDRSEAAAEVAVFDATIDGLKTEATALRSQIASLRSEIGILAQQRDVRRELFDRGHGSKLAALDAERALEDRRGQLAGAQADLAALERGLTEAQSDKARLLAQRRSEARAEQEAAEAEALELEAQLAKLSDRVERLAVRAPVRGVIQSVLPKGPGAVIPPGGVIAELVPVGDTLMAEIRLAPSDIGHVHRGDPARIKVSSFDAARFGSIDGQVRHISASTFDEDAQGATFYKGIIALDQAAFERGGEQYQIIPGMVVTAEIVTGRRSFAAYLLKPILRGFDNAFWER